MMKRSNHIIIAFLVILAFSLCACSNGDSGSAPQGDYNGDGDIEIEDDIERVTLDLVEGCNPFSSSEECLTPLPIMFFEKEDASSPTKVRGDYPLDAVPTSTGDNHFDIEFANLADGCSPAAPILLHFGVDIAPEHLLKASEIEQSLEADYPIALFNLETGKRLLFMAEMDMNRKEAYPDRYAFIVRPMEPMEMGDRHVVAFTGDLTDVDGKALESPEAFRVLRDGVFTTNPEIENVRAHFEELFEFLEGKGYPRDELLLAWDFSVASDEWLLGSVLSMREKALAEIASDLLGYTIDEEGGIEDDPNENVARLVRGSFEVSTFINEEDSIEYDSDHHPIRREDTQSFPFTMIIPQKARSLGEPLPLLVFGHGIFGEGREYLTGGLGRDFIQPLAEEFGAVIIATDWIGLSGGDLDRIIQEVVGDLNRVRIVTDRLQQSLINNLIMTELAVERLSVDPQLKVGENELIDSTRVYYYGVSLGGIMGSSFTSISNRIERGVLAVPGSVWSNMLTRSIHWNMIKIPFYLQYPDPLVQQMGIFFIQGLFDHSDPVNLTRLLYRSPLDDAPEGRRVIVLESIGDSQVPNMTTEILARAMGVKVMTPSVYDLPGLQTVASPTEESVIVQYHMVEQVLANPPPETNVPPETGNGVHADILFKEHVVDQLKHFFSTGEVVQYCEGACDPD